MSSPRPPCKFSKSTKLTLPLTEPLLAALVLNVSLPLVPCSVSDARRAGHGLDARKADADGDGNRARETCERQVVAGADAAVERGRPAITAVVDEEVVVADHAGRCAAQCARAENVKLSPRCCRP